ncbi:MAG: amidohydrolase family protein [Sphingomonas sp.]|uniref:amidohydrolase family protein n=1 Tax=Sphingomonas sp. TaxID=28214 RepID=UPI002276C59C|nr:amidohydrolase family protein [Sphingomonas sp.]MCX8477195.1 amidohydrolase family protein [Sphingomonas sp.]
MRLLVRARNRALAVAGGRIVAAEGPFDVVIDAPGSELLPGLINAHDHLHRNHYGRLGRPPYPNAYAWAVDIQRRDAAAIAAGRGRPRREALLDGAWKNLFAGVTSVVHHDRWEADFERSFPLRVVRIAQADSLGMGGLPTGFKPAQRFCLHLAEGMDAAAADEIRTLDDAGQLSSRLIAVHGVGMDRDAIDRFRASGAALVWCPSSNLFLFGRTAPAGLLAEGLDLLLGSDSMLTGDGDLLDELRCARELGMVSDARLAGAVGATAARVLGLPEPTLARGASADLVLMARPLLGARASDVQMVMAGGRLRVLHPELVAAFAPKLPLGAMRAMGGVTRWTSDHTEPDDVHLAPRSECIAPIRQETF